MADKQISPEAKDADKKKYVCATGMNFESLKGQPRVEAGQPIPEGLTPKQIKEYIEGGLIKEV